MHNPTTKTLPANPTTSPPIPPKIQPPTTHIKALIKWWLYKMVQGQEAARTAQAMLPPMKGVRWEEQPLFGEQCCFVWLVVAVAFRASYPNA